MQETKIDIKSLYDSLAEKYEVHSKKSYEVIYPEDYEIKVLGNKYVKLVAVSRHKTQKHLMKVVVSNKKKIDSLDLVGQKSLLRRYDEVVVTTDHICMVYNDDHFFENINAKNLKTGNYVSVYDEADDKDSYLYYLNELSKANVFGNKEGHSWVSFAKHINSLIDMENDDTAFISEDKKLAPFFVNEEDVSSVQAFCNKVIFRSVVYLFICA